MEESELSDPEASSSASTEPLASPGKAAASSSRAKRALKEPTDEDEDDEPLPKEYGHTRPIKEIKARRRAAGGAGSDSSLTSQDSDSSERPIASSSLKVPPARRAGLRKTATAEAVSDVSEASEADERDSTSPEIYRPRPGVANKSRRRKPPALETGHLADESGQSGLPTPVSPPPTPVINGKKRRRADEGIAASNRTAKSARLEKQRSLSPAVARGKLRETVSQIKVEEAAPVETEEPHEELQKMEEEPSEAAEEVLPLEEEPEEPMEEEEALQPEPEPAIEIEVEPTSDREDDPINDPANRARLEAMEELVRIEIKFAKVREALFHERAEVNHKERQTIEDGTHPELQHFTTYLDEKQSSRMHLARQMYINTERMIVHQVDVDERNAWRWWEDSRMKLRSELLLFTQRKRRQYDRDRTFGGKWDKAEEGDKYREIYEDHSRRRALTEEMAEAEYLAESAIRETSTGISPLSAAAIQTDLAAMSLRSPASTPASSTYPPLYGGLSSMGPYGQLAAPRPPTTTGQSSPAPYIAAASAPSMAFIPQPRTMPSPLSAAPFPPRASLSSMEAFQSLDNRVRSPPNVSPNSPVSAGKAGHAHRPSLDAHMERKAASTPNSFQSRFILPPIPPFQGGGTRTHSAASSNAPSPGHQTSSNAPTAPATTSAPLQKPMMPEIPAFRFPAPAPTVTATGSS